MHLLSPPQQKPLATHTPSPKIKLSMCSQAEPHPHCLYTELSCSYVKQHKPKQHNPSMWKTLSHQAGGNSSNACRGTNHTLTPACIVNYTLPKMQQQWHIQHDNCTAKRSDYDSPSLQTSRIGVGGCVDDTKGMANHRKPRSWYTTPHALLNPTPHQHCIGNAQAPGLGAPQSLTLGWYPHQPHRLIAGSIKHSNRQHQTNPA